MRHGKSFNHLGRKSAHRNAMLSNMASSLILNKRIETTTAKAKALRRYIEPLITKSKNDTTHSRRVVFSYLNNKYAVSELFREVSSKITDRPGGYTRILKTGKRLGDNADMCIIELVDYNENMLAAGEDRKSRSRRRRGSGKKKTTDQVVETKQEVSEVVDQDEEQAEEVTEVVEEQTADSTPLETVETDEQKEETLVEQEAKSDDAVVTEEEKAESAAEVVEEVKEETESEEEVIEEAPVEKSEEEAVKPEAESEEKEEGSKPEADDKKENTEKSE